MMTVSPPTAAVLSLVLLAVGHRASSEVATSTNNGPHDAAGSGSNQNVTGASPKTTTTMQPTPEAETTQKKTTSSSSATEVELPRIVSVLGVRCSRDQDCVAINNHSRCVDDVCSCQPGYVPSKHNFDKCLRVSSGLGDGCEEGAQCEHAAPNSECVAGACQCPPGYVFDETRCWMKQAVGGACNTSKQCEDVTFAECAQGVCSCEPPMVPGPTNTKCLQPAGASYGASCAEDIQCTVSYGDEARCSHGQCRCVNAYHYNGSYCLPDLLLGSDCQTDAECAVSEEAVDEAASRVCLPDGCACAPGYARLDGEHLCSLISAGQELAVTFTWLLCIVVAKYLS